MKKSTWKMIAIIFIVLFIIETCYISWGFYLVLDKWNKEDYCVTDVCEYSYDLEKWIGDYDSYSYDYNSNICSCWKGNGIVREVYLK